MADRLECRLYLLVIIALATTAAAGLIVDGPQKTFSDFILLQTSGARLINDFTVTGIGGAFLNAASVACIGLLLVRFSDVRLGGPTLAAVFTMWGFGFFGKSPVNILPIIAGVWIVSRMVGKSLGSYSLVALFGTALGPVVTYVMFEMPISPAIAIPLGVACGILVGMLLPAIASALLQFHQGYNLYNIGFACGFLGLFLSSLLEATGTSRPLGLVWNTTPHPLLQAVIPALSFLLIGAGFLVCKKSPKDIVEEVLQLQKLSGRLPTDMFDIANTASPLINMGALGLAAWLFVVLVGGPFNGPVLGAMLTVMGFGAFGKTLRNTWPIVAGVCLAAWLFGKQLSAPGPLLASLFSTTLAPIAGRFGIKAGMVAGALHLLLVETTAQWHGGLDLYNNGFAGGLTATLVIIVMHWFQNNRTKEDFEQ
jgi:hypothetical protein